MRTLFISDSLEGGAARACRRLVRRLDYCDWITAQPGKDALAQSLPRKQDWREQLIARYAGRWHTRQRLALRHRNRLTAARIGKYAKRLSPDIINIHNIHMATDFSLLQHLPKNVPLIWTLHDMWPLTGYCCYSYECQKFETGCVGGCPQAGKWWNQTTRTAAEGWRERQRCLDPLKGRLSFVAPSEWLADAARKRFKEAFAVTCIPNGLDLNVFYPLGDRAMLREYLGLPRQGKIILTGAAVANDPRKGGYLLKDAVAQLLPSLHEPLHVVVFGGVDPNEPVPDGWHYAGRIQDDKLLNLYYNAADAFVHPSLADNLPNTLVEATAAGTPSVTFDIGGCGEIVRHKKTGFVAKYIDVEDLAKGIAWVLGQPEEGLRCMREACRDVAVREYDVALMAKRYEALFGRAGCGVRDAGCE